MPPLKTLEELQGELADAELAFDQTNAALQGLMPDADEQTRKDLDAKFAAHEAEVRKLSSDIDRLKRMDDAIKAVPRNTDVVVGHEPHTYEKGVRENNGEFRSFFRDLFRSEQGDVAAAGRIARHAREVAVEQRDITTGSGGVGLVPPQYLIDELAVFARSSRPFADALGPRPLPDTGMTFNVPRVTTGTATAVQANQGDAPQETNVVSDYLSFTVNTVAGMQDVSRQLLDRSDPATDTVIGQDLAADYAKQLDTQLLTQATNGITVLSGTNAVTYTQATPTAATFYPKIADAIQQVWTNRFSAPDLIVMHPRRWAQLLGGVDTTGRPLVLPDTVAGLQAFNVMSIGDGRTPSGLVGQIQGLPVVVDANIPITLGAGTNQDVVIVTRRADQLLFEVGSPTVQVETGVLVGTLQVRIVAYGYFAFTFARYAKATSIISGTGLVPPTF